MSAPPSRPLTSPLQSPPGAAIPGATPDNSSSAAADTLQRLATSSTSDAGVGAGPVDMSGLKDATNSGLFDSSEQLFVDSQASTILEDRAAGAASGPPAEPITREVPVPHISDTIPGPLSRTSPRDLVADTTEAVLSSSPSRFRHSTTTPGEVQERMVTQVPTDRTRSLLSPRSPSPGPSSPGHPTLANTTVLHHRRSASFDEATLRNTHQVPLHSTPTPVAAPAPVAAVTDSALSPLPETGTNQDVLRLTA